MGYPLEILLNPPPPTYPEYEALAAEAHRTCGRFVNPANLYPEAGAVRRRGADWATAVLGRPHDLMVTRITLFEQYLLIAADRADVNPPLPQWIVDARAETAARNEAVAAGRAALRQRDIDTWTAAREHTTVELNVHTNPTARARGGQNHHLAHAVPVADVYSGTGSVRTHRADRALCETPGRATPLHLNTEPEPEDTPVTCRRCLHWMPNVRSQR